MADNWTIVGQLNIGRDCEFQSALLPDGKSVLITGGLVSGTLDPTSSCEIFDFETGQAVFTDSLPITLYGHCLVELDLIEGEDEEYLTIGGHAPPYNVGRCFRYSSTTNTWQETGELNHRHSEHAAIAYQDTDETIKVLVAGGCTGDSRKICEIYDPQTGTWEITDELNEGRIEHTLIYFPSHQKILVVGDDNSATAELFDIPSRTWTLTTPIPVPCPQYENGASQLIIENGQEKALIMAGTSGGNNWLTSCWIFDPITETWTETDSLTRGGVGMPSAKLPNGDIIVSGGCRTDEQYMTSPITEIYDVEQRQWQRVADMNFYRSHHNLVTLADGRVVAIGGSTLDGAVNVELYSWNDSPEIQIIQEQNSGLVGDTLEFVIQVNDPNEDSVSIRINWDDGDTTDWQEYDASGAEFCFSKVFTEAGEYTIQAQAKDIGFEQGIHNSLTDWQNLLTVAINHPIGIDPEETLASEFKFELFQNYPNPFNSSTCISYQIPQDSWVKLSVFNLLGQEVDVLVNEFQEANEYVINWQPKNLCSGIYIYQLTIESAELKRTLNKKLVMME